MKLITDMSEEELAADILDRAVRENLMASVIRAKSVLGEKKAGLLTQLCNAAGINLKQTCRRASAKYLREADNTNDDKEKERLRLLSQKALEIGGFE